MNSASKLILDIGCGTGYRTYQLSKTHHNKVIGIDISKENIKLAKQKYPQLDYKEMNAEKIEFKNNTFDCIYAIDVLEHVDNLETVLKEIGRVLKRKGKLIVIVPGEKSEKWLLQLRPSYFKEIHHVRIFKNNQLEAFLKEYGLQLLIKKPKNFIQHVELYYFFKVSQESTSQTEIGKWNDNVISIFVHAFISSFDPYWVFHTPLKYIPVWFITLPLGAIINYVGNKRMPKSIYYEFIKI